RVAPAIDGDELAPREDPPVVVEFFGRVGRLGRVHQLANLDQRVVIRRFGEAESVVAREHGRHLSDVVGSTTERSIRRGGPPAGRSSRSMSAAGSVVDEPRPVIYDDDTTDR